MITQQSVLTEYKTTENIWKIAADTTGTVFETAAMTAMSKFKNTVLGLAYLYGSTIGKTSLLTVYSNNQTGDPESGDPELEVPAIPDPVLGFDYEEMFGIFLDEYGDEGAALLFYVQGKGYEIAKSEYSWWNLVQRHDWWMDGKTIRIGNTDWGGIADRSPSNAAAQLKESLDDIVNNERLQQISDNCIGNDYATQPAHVRAYRMTTAVLIVSDITGFVKVENAIVGKGLLNEDLTTGKRLLSGTFGAVEGLFMVVPGAKIVTASGGKMLSRAGVSLTAGSRFGGILLCDVTGHLGKDITAKLLQTVAGQGMLKAFNKIYYSRANLTLWGSKLPQGISRGAFQEVSNLIRQRAGNISGDIVVQGSRASGMATATSDIDIAIRVSADQFDEMTRLFYGTPNPNSALSRTMQHSIDNGIIHARRCKLSGLRDEIAKILGMDVDLSIIKIGGNFDAPPFIPLQ